MNPQPTYKKFLLPGLIIIALVVIGLLLFLKDGAVDQGAALFTGVTKTSSLRAIPPVASNCRPTVGANGLPVAPAPSVKVTSPNGGEVFMAGQQITVKWSSCNFTGNVVVTLIQPNSGGFAAWTLSSSYQNSGQGTFTLPTTSQWGNMIYGNNFKIMIGDVQSNGTVQDISDNLFTINSRLACKPTDPAVVRVDSPNGGELYHPGQQLTVRWQSCNVPASSQVIVLLESSAGVIPYLTNDPNIPSILSSNDGIETFVIPTSNYSGLIPGLYKARVTTTQVAASDWSDNFFTIQ